MRKEVRARIRAQKWHDACVSIAEAIRPGQPEQGTVRYEPRSADGWLRPVHKVMARKRGPPVQAKSFTFPEPADATEFETSCRMAYEEAISWLAS